MLVLAALPALDNLSDVLLAEPISVSRRTRSLALHSAAGVVLAIVGVVLMPRALDANLPWLSVLSFALGGVTYFLIDQAIVLYGARSLMSSRSTKEEKQP